MMFWLQIIFLLSLLPATAHARAVQPWQGGTGCESPVTIANLPGTPEDGTICMVTDGDSTAGNCSTTNTDSFPCYYDGAAWQPIGVGKTQEEIEDFAGAMVTGNTETCITVTYQDADGTIDYVVSASNACVTELDWTKLQNYASACGAGTFVTAVGDTLTCDTPAGAGDITDVFNCASGDCNSVALADGDLLNMSSVSVSGTAEGLILPQHATDCSTAGTAEGQVCWEADADALYVGDGATVKAITAGHGDGANCAAGEIPLGVDASGAVQGCYEPAEADISDLAHTATAVTDGLIVEADLNEDSGTPTDGDLLEYDSTGANFVWVAHSTVAAGTAAALAANGGNCAAGEIPLGVDTAGAVEGCYEPTEADISDLAHTATDVACTDCVDPTDIAAADFTDFTCSAGDACTLDTGVVDANELAASITFADGDLLDFGSNVTGATEGIMLPAHATSCATATAEGQVCWEEDAKQLWVGDGAAPVNINAGSPGALLDDSNQTDTTVSAVTRGDIIIGNATPDWDDLAIGGANTVLTSDGTDPSWGTCNATACPGTIVTAGDNLTLTGTDVDWDGFIVENSNSNVDATTFIIDFGEDFSVTTDGTSEVDVALDANTYVVGDEIQTADLPTVLIPDDTNGCVGTGSEWCWEYDDGVDDQLLLKTTKTGTAATTDPMLEVLVGTTPTADQQVFGIAKGTQASNTPLFTVDEDGDLTWPGTATGTVTGLPYDLQFGFSANYSNTAQYCTFSACNALAAYRYVNQPRSITCTEFQAELNAATDAGAGTLTLALYHAEDNDKTTFTCDIAEASGTTCSDTSGSLQFDQNERWAFYAKTATSTTGLRGVRMYAKCTTD